MSTCLNCGLQIYEHTGSDLFWCRKELYRQELLERIKGLSEEEAIALIARELTATVAKMQALPWPKG